ncbi:uncharacterized protein LOC124305835 [Neodiprion virginianus]|uniref:uncharacterized protein LOC124183440 n=1 Tax=Neodiprion fabricii TaxID=2872261 RepID=UPI001ED91625|nr:uncharacterized protein LOC124183440 [Neodiprion fabricii]XP_046621689.1 uncharacterized protein LOC124305835 [Neodiprion virginianus]
MKNFVETQLSWLALLLTAFYSLLASCRGESCGPEELARCARPLQTLSSDWSELVTTKEQLQRVCIELSSAVSCIKRYTAQCMNEPQRQHFNELYVDVNTAIMELCQEGPYQDNFLKHMPCMQQVKPQFDSCSHKYTAQMQEMRVIKPNDPMKEICCSFQNYLDCSYRTVLVKCGEETATFTKEFFDRTSSSLIKKHCEKFPIKKCLSSSGAVAKTEGLFLSIVLLTVGRYLFL